MLWSLVRLLLHSFYLRQLPHHSPYYKDDTFHLRFNHKAMITLCRKSTLTHCDIFAWVIQHFNNFNKWYSSSSHDNTTPPFDISGPLLLLMWVGWVCFYTSSDMKEGKHLQVPAQTTKCFHKPRWMGVIITENLIAKL